MATSDATGIQKSDLNGFLFADVGIEANGMTLSVASVLARQGSDPWLEAGRLADLSNTAATSSLAGMIAAMPHSPWNLLDATPIAARLTGLLPARPARAAGRVVRLGAGQWPSGRMVVALACAALVAAFALSGTVLQRSTGGIESGDAASSTSAVSRAPH